MKDQIPVKEQNVALPKWPSVVPRNEISVSRAKEHAGLEVRPFVAHQILHGAVPDSTVALAWTRAAAGQEVEQRSHATPGLLIVLSGRAKLTGKSPRWVEQGDAVTLPPHHPYGFTQVEPGGLHALHVAFRSAEGGGARDVTSLQALLTANDRRVQMALSGPSFRMLDGGALDSERARARFRDCARVFSDAFQTILFAREATTSDETYEATFHAHLIEELGHNKLLTVPPDGKGPTDAILKATANWFCHQMLIVDNADKAVVHLVLETAGFHFHTLAEPVLADVSAGYFSAHSEADDADKDVVIQLLQGHHPETYRRLHRTLEQSWDMFDAMIGRIVELVELEAASS